MLKSGETGIRTPVPRSTTVFKTAAIDHSATSQNSFKKYFLPESGAKVRFYFKTANS